ncbi:Beta-mannosyltransferase 1 [Cercospora beticola]|uniref:Beta-mannosyltransferase 1 n=1 Tax=Cercospora beticola TaxID=122368 RepID=A0A2G5HDI0_CERBT|nr:Beta-mannosyltransferase 1 [Cercospora beticola]PIA90591.1 Beta-mannosyltransferase 1 [Cercospora beticola]WPB08258.1 hypothetical protein RHO25_012923 [Cercospora beticola]
MKQWDDEKMLDAPTPSSSVRGVLNRLSGRLWNPRRRIVRTAVCVILLTFGCASYWRSQVPSLDDLLPSSAAFTSSNVSGFVNMGAMQKHETCDEIRHRGEISVQESLHVDDDLVAIAKSLDDHPMVDYGGGKKQHTFEHLVSKTWLRMAQSSVWLEKYQVYLTVTRVLFYNKGVRHWPAISFVRGQIHDRHWKELKGYVIRWQDERIVFPRIFDIPIPYFIGGGFYGPEDPRIIIEDHPDAEPVIVFNMLGDLDKSRRSMWVYRPFSNKATELAMRGKEPGGVEKNWMPFFYKSQNKEESKIPGPNRYLHFVYLFAPLTIVKCRLQYGWCDEVYHQQIPDEHRIEHKNTIYNDTGGSLRGGTNFQAVTLADGKQSFVGFPRTHVDGTCHDGVYRPELAVLSATADNQFHLDYLSGPLDFGTAVIHNSSDICAEGRILIANSIAKWDKTAADDTMTLSVSVDDFTTEVVRIRGVHSLLQSLPGISTPHTEDTSENDNLALAVPGYDVLGCCLESAIRGAEEAYTLSPQKIRNDAEKEKRKKEDEEKRQKEEEGKRKEEEERKSKEEDEKKRKEEEERKLRRKDKQSKQKETENKSEGERSDRVNESNDTTDLR